MTYDPTEPAPPPDDDLFESIAAAFPPPDGPPVNAVGQPASLYTGIENALVRIAKAIERLGTVPAPVSAPSAPPGPPQAYGPPPSAPPPAGGPDPVKMGKKVYAICRAKGWDVGGIGQQILGKPVNPNSQKWSVEDLKVVLDQFAAWGEG